MILGGKRSIHNGLTKERVLKETKLLLASSYQGKKGNELSYKYLYLLLLTGIGIPRSTKG